MKKGEIITRTIFCISFFIICLVYIFAQVRIGEWMSFCSGVALCIYFWLTYNEAKHLIFDDKKKEEEDKKPMKVLTKAQLEEVLGDGTIFSQDDVDELFEKYGDDYYKDYGAAPFELCEENPHWKDKRGQDGYPVKGSVY